MVKLIRIFGGVEFAYYTVFAKKSDAIRSAKWWRSRNVKARVIKVKNHQRLAREILIEKGKPAYEVYLASPARVSLIKKFMPRRI